MAFTTADGTINTVALGEFHAAFTNFQSLTDANFTSLDRNFRKSAEEASQASASLQNEMSETSRSIKELLEKMNKRDEKMLLLETKTDSLTQQLTVKASGSKASDSDLEDHPKGKDPLKKEDSPPGLPKDPPDAWAAAAAEAPTDTRVSS